MIRTKNPAMREEIFDVAANQYGVVAGTRMSLAGTMQKTGILFAILIAFAVIGWMFYNPLVMIVSLVVALILGIVTTFKPAQSPILAPIYACFEGVFLGGISFVLAAQAGDTRFGPAVPVAVFATLVTFSVMLALYGFRIITLTNKMKSVIVGMTLAVALFYGIAFMLSFFMGPQIQALSVFGGGPIGIGFSLFVIGLAAFNLLLDFEMIEYGVQTGAPKYMEWYGGFGLMVTIVWLYIEILRLLAKLRR